MDLHPYQTEGNMSPLQWLKVYLKLKVRWSNLSHKQVLICLDEDPESVQVPSNKFVPCTQLSVELLVSVHPMSQCNNFDKFYHRAADGGPAFIYKLFAAIANYNILTDM